MKKFVAAVLVILMLVAMLPISVFAANPVADVNFGDTPCDFYNVIEKNDYNLAPGAVESEIIINDDSGSNRNVVHVIEVDPSDPNIIVMPTFKNISEDVDYTDEANWGVQELTKQAAHVEENLGLNVVGGMNVSLSWAFTYPYGLLIYNGKVLFDDRANHPGGGYLAIDKDGKAELRDANAPLTGDEWMAQTICFNYIVKDGKSLHTTANHSSDPAPRSVIGIKADGTLVLMMNDGRQAPYSKGFNNHEMANMMLALGCVDAINCDGGGSSTFISEREGSGELTMKSSPSDGSERSTLTGILVVSKAVADGKFDHAVVDTEDAYVTPGSTVEFTVGGADSAGGPADVPADITWQLTDPEMGTVENGVFVSSGKEGTATVQVVYNGEVVGEDSVEVVVPTDVKFTMDNITVPYGKSLALEVVATVNDGVNVVKTKDGDFVFTLSDAALGTVSGNTFTAASEATVTEGTVTVTYKDTDVTATANLFLGRGSEVVYDFEDGTTGNITWKSGYLSRSAVGRGEMGTMEVVTAENGRVHSGDKALKLVADFTKGTAAGYREMRLGDLGIDLTDAVSVGMWMYLPSDAIGHDSRWLNSKGTQIGTGLAFGACGTTYAEDGWYYVSLPVSSANIDLNGLRMGVNDVKGEDAWNWFGKYTFYIDDITVDYSSAVEDREAPVFSNAYVEKGESEAYDVLDGQTVTTNEVTVYASVAENTTKSNYTGINASSAKVYVDGKALTTGYSYSSDGRINVVDLELADGTHTFKFEIADNAGNVATFSRQIVINGTDGDVYFVPANPDAEKIAIGSIQYFNLVAKNIENIDTVTAVVDLDAMSSWELEGIETAAGFKATYTLNEDTNTATVTVKKVGNVTATGETVLAKIPARTWESTFHLNNNNPELVTDNPSNQDKAMILTPHAMWYSDGVWKVAIIAQAESIDVTYTDNTTDTFSSDEYRISTELYFHYADRPQSRLNEWSWHVHTPVAVADKAATCTEDGYTGRTVCAGCSCGTVENLGTECTNHDGCGSVVDWGTVVEATGHNYIITDGKLACEDCGTVNEITGLYKDGDVYRYLFLGEVQTGWRMIGSDWYYFNESTQAAKAGTYRVGAVSFTFEENGRLVSGTWGKTLEGTRYYYGPSYYYRGWYTIDGVDYLFRNGYRCEGIDCYKASGMPTVWYDFGEDGASATLLNGIYEVEGVDRYFEDGLGTEKGLVKVNGDYYYTTYEGKIAKDKTLRTAVTNCDLPNGTYTFGADGKMIGKSAEGEIVEVDGNICYYVNGVGVEAGLVCVDGNYYYTTYRGVVATNKTINVSIINCDFEKGKYTFGADGKMIGASADGEVVELDGVLYYYENGVGVEKGLVECDGNYYYAAYKGQLVVNKVLNTPFTSCDMPRGRYEFGADGKMVNGIVEKDGVLYYYENGQGVEKGLLEFEGNYYYAAYNGQLVVNKVLNTPFTSCDMPVGRYEFGADGKMINGIIERNGVYYYYENGQGVEKGLFFYEGNYYYAAYKGQLVVNKVLNTPMTSCDMPRGRYEFGADGKMLNGIVEKDGVLYYYENGVGVEKGLIQVEGDYYYAAYLGKLVVNKAISAPITNCDMPTGKYEFGADGKMLQGIVDKDGVLYYYENGAGVEKGLIEIDGDYYYAAYQGKLVAGKTINAAVTSCDLPLGKYEFGADCKMLQGIVEKDGVLYYYENGQGVEKGLIYVDGDYYYAAYKGQLVVNKSLTVTNTNGLLISALYKFDELGRIVG